MSPRRTSASLFVFVFVIVSLAVVLAPQPAQASSEPPFEIRFPQEAGLTQLHDDFGARRSGGRRHRGNDLMAPKLTRVYAIADGTVVTIGTSRRAGRYLVVDHGDGWTSTYIHLNNDNPGTDDGDAPWSLTVAHRIVEGADVVAGQIIGWVGDSGNAERSAPHTHFELAVNGRSVDPYGILEEAWERDLATSALLTFYETNQEWFETIL